MRGILSSSGSESKKREVFRLLVTVLLRGDFAPLYTFIGRKPRLVFYSNVKLLIVFPIGEAKVESGLDKFFGEFLGEITVCSLLGDLVLYSRY